MLQTNPEFLTETC